MLNKKESSFVRSKFPLGRTRREEDSTTKDGGVRSTTKEEGPQSMPKDEGTLQTQPPPKEVRTELNPGEEWTISSLWKPIANTLEFIFRGAGEATSGVSVPGLEGLIKGAIYVMDSADLANENQTSFQRLRTRLDTCRSILSHYDESTPVPPRIQEAKTNLRSAILAACDAIPDDGRGKFKRMIANREDASLFQTTAQAINEALDIFQVEIGLSNTDQLGVAISNIKQTNALMDKRLLDKLTNVVGAYYNSKEREHVTTRCQDNTRKEVIKKITKWIDSRRAPPVFWLYSQAGVGKSTVARSIAENCDKRNVLAGHFFFSRAKDDRATTDGFFSTLALQLSNFEPRLVPYLVDAVKKNLSISGLDNDETFSQLLAGPLGLLKKEQVPITFPMVVVIDALDECQHKDAEKVLQLLLGLHNELGRPSPPILKFLITSRREHHIQSVFIPPPPTKNRPNSHKDSPPKFQAYRLRPNTNDVDRYLKQELKRIRSAHPECFATSDPWPSQDDFAKLSSKAAGLFIYAATVVKFVGSENKHPVTRLKMIMDTGSLQSREIYCELDALYDQIMLQMQTTCSNSDKARIRLILGAILFAFEPLSAKQLELLFELDVGQAQLDLRELSSVLVVPTDDDQPIRVTHSSFYDFLTKRSGNWHLDASAPHRSLAAACTKLIEDTYKDGWHALKDASSARRKLLAYACNFWHRHLIQSNPLDPTQLKNKLLAYACNFWHRHSNPLPTQLKNKLLAYACNFWHRHLIQSNPLPTQLKNKLLAYACNFWHRHLIQSNPLVATQLKNKLLLRRWFEVSVELQVDIQPALSRIFDQVRSNQELCKLLCDELYKFGVGLARTDVRHMNYHGHPALEFFKILEDNYPGDPPHQFKIYHASVVRRYSSIAEWTEQSDVIKKLKLGLEAVLQSLPNGHEDRGLCLLELALFNEYVDRTESSIPCFRQALANLKDFNKVICYNSFGLALLGQSKTTGDISLLDRAIKIFRWALFTPRPQPLSPTMVAAVQNNLGSAHAARFKHLGEDKDAEAALEAFETVLNNPAASPSTAFEASFIRAQVLNSCSRGSPLAAYRLALTKAIHISWIALPLNQVGRVWEDVITCGEEAFIVAKNEGDMWGAVECFNQCYTTFWEDSLQFNGLLPRFQQQHRLDTAPSEYEGGQEPMYSLNADCNEFPLPTEPRIRMSSHKYNDPPQAQRDRMGMKEKYKKFVVAHPEFSQGRVILLCAEGRQTFALVIGPETSDDVLSIPLSIEVETLAFLNSVHDYWEDVADEMLPKETLQNAWNLVAKPIISKLELKPEPPLPRIWWCASKPFMAFPIHAATNYKANPHEYLTDYVVSSYIPSLSWLFDQMNYHTSTGMQHNTKRSGVLGLPREVPSAYHDDRSSYEWYGPFQDIVAISSTISSRQLLSPPQPLHIEQVLTKMRECSGIHSCTPYFTSWQTDFNQPQMAGLWIDNDSLSVYRLSSEPTLPQFVYLSPCPPRPRNYPTARIPYDLLAIGFSSVVVPLTDISSGDDSAAMASAFCSELLRLGGGPELDFRFAARALHAAMIKVRTQCGDEPKGNWAMMVHIGI